jgi:flagella basal body P-ring formation protein FlgA
MHTYSESDCQTPSRSGLALWGVFFAGAFAGLFAPVALAQNVADVDYSAIALKWAQGAAAQSVPAGVKLKMEVTVGSLDSRLKLAPCPTVEPYVPMGSRLWGRSRVGLRCVDGATRWNVSVPVTVKAVGMAWVVRGQVASGGVITQSDVVQAEVDWAEETSPVVQEQSAWLGQIATRQLTTGMVLRQGMVKAAQVFQAGAQVRIVAQGAGFEIESEAEALSAGVVGQPARVRMDNGRITSGQVLDARTVRIDI